MLFRSYWFTLVLLLATLSISVSTFASTIILKPKAYIDVVTGKRVDNIFIVVRDDKIIDISTEINALYQDATLLELNDAVLLPGLIDSHVHMTSDARAHGYERLRNTATRSALKGVKFAKQTLMAGITTVRNVGASGYIDVDLRDAINAGEIDGPRMFVSGPSIGITGGHCDSNLLSHYYKARAGGVADGPWQVVEKVRENIKYGADVIKFCATGGVLSKGTKVGVQQYSQAEMNALVEEAHRRGLTVAAHAHGTDGIKAAIKAGVDSVEHASFIDEEGIKLAKRAGTFLSMDIYVTEYILGEGAAAGILEESLAKERVTGRTQRTNFTKAYKAGAKMVMGTDAGVYPHGQNLKQLSRMVEFGMSPIDAIRAASINGATLLNREEMLGSINVGKVADIIAVQGDPLENITLLESVSFVMKSGKIYKHTPLAE